MKKRILAFIFAVILLWLAFMPTEQYAGVNVQRVRVPVWDTLYSHFDTLAAFYFRIDTTSAKIPTCEVADSAIGANYAEYADSAIGAEYAEYADSTSAMDTTYEPLKALIGDVARDTGFLETEVGDIEGVTAGNGLTDGGTSGTVTLNVGAGTGITVNANDVQIDYSWLYTAIDTTSAVIDSAVGAERATKIDTTETDFQTWVNNHDDNDTVTAYRQCVFDSIQAHWNLFADTVEHYREAIADSISAHWTIFVTDNNDTVTAYRAAIHDSLDAHWSTFTAGGSADSNWSWASIDAALRLGELADSAGRIVLYSADGTDSLVIDVANGIITTVSNQAINVDSVHANQALFFVSDSVMFPRHVSGATYDGYILMYDAGGDSLKWIKTEDLDSIKTNRDSILVIGPLAHEAKDSLTSWANKVNAAADSLTSWANEVNDHTDSVAAWTAIINEAKDSLTSWANKINGATDSLALWTALINEAKDSLTSWANEVNAATDSLAAWANKVNEHEDSVTTWTALINEAKDSLTSWANEVNVATDSLISWANEVNEATDSIAAWTNLINEGKDSLTSWGNKVNLATDSISTWTGLINEAKDSLTAWANQVNDNSDDIDELETDPRYLVNVYNPNSLWSADSLLIGLEPRTEAAITITRIEVTCLVDPSTELDFDLMWADAFIGNANRAVIDEMNTTNGAASITTGFDDATIAANKCIYIRFNAEPDADINQVVVRVTYTID